MIKTPEQHLENACTEFGEQCAIFEKEIHSQNRWFWTVRKWLKEWWHYWHKPVISFVIAAAIVLFIVPKLFGLFGWVSPSQEQEIITDCLNARYSDIRKAEGVYWCVGVRGGDTVAIKWEDIAK